MNSQVIDIIRPTDIVTAEVIGNKYEGHIDCTLMDGPYYRLEFSFVHNGVRLYSAISVLEEQVTQVKREGRRIYWRGHHLTWS